MNELVGQKLHQARLAQGLTISKVSQDTYIRAHHIEALENGDFSALPSAAQVRGFLRAYAEYLGLDADELFASLQQVDVPTVPVQIQADAEDEQQATMQPTEEPAQQTESIFSEIGAAIRQRREVLGLTLDEIESHTRVPSHYLNLIEGGQFDRFPSPTQARGMLGSYAGFLDMNTNAVLLRYAEALQSRLAVQQASGQSAQNSNKESSAPQLLLPLWLRNVFSVDVLAFSVIGITVIFFAIWGIGRVLDTRAGIEPQPTAPPLAQMLLPSATDEPSPTVTLIPTDEPAQPEAAAADAAAVGEEVQPEQAALEVTLPPFSGEYIQLYIVVRQRTFMRVTVDGEVQFEGRVNVGGNYPYTANQSIEVLTGNGAALQIFLNDADLGPMGIFGEVVNVIYTREGALTPTPTITPTLKPGQMTPTASPSPTLEAQ